MKAWSKNPGFSLVREEIWRENKGLETPVSAITFRPSTDRLVFTDVYYEYYELCLNLRNVAIIFSMKNGHQARRMNGKLRTLEQEALEISLAY